MLPQKSKKRSSERLRELWPDIREMMHPRRRILAAGFALMIVSRVCGLVLPVSTKYLVDNVIGKKQMQLLTPLVLAVLAATVIQGENDVYLHSGGFYEWDTAAPVAVARAAGLHVSRIDGSDVVYNQENPLLPDILVCRPAIASLLLNAVREATHAI